MARKIVVNRKKLIIEVVIIGVIVAIPYVVNFWLWLMRQPTGIDPYHDEKSLLRRVEEFDYDKGDRVKLEADLRAATKLVGRRPVRYFFNMYAMAKYYCEIGRYDDCAEILEIAVNYGPSRAYVAEAEALKEYADGQ